MVSAFQTFRYRAANRLLKFFIAIQPQAKPALLLGQGSAERLCETIARFGYRKVLIVTDAPLVQLGMIDPIVNSLKAQGVDAEIFDEVEPDPTDTIIFKGEARALSCGADAVLAVGGGSSMDAGKVIAVATAGLKPLEGPGLVKGMGLPLFAIPTTAGTGSEATTAAVITDTETQTKKGMGGPGFTPVAAALDPLLMQKLPPSITAATGMDALTHAIEAFISHWHAPGSDRYALASAKLIFDNLPTAYSNGEDLDARESMAIAAAYGGFAINSALVGYTHAIAHHLGARYHLPHGLLNAVLLPHVLEYSREAASPRLAEMARFVGLGGEGSSESELVDAILAKITALNKTLDIPEKLDAIKQEDIPSLVEGALKEGRSYPVPLYMDEDSCTAILKAVSH